MAFPVVQTADTQNGIQSNNSTSWTLTYPTNLANNDLILATIAMDDAAGAQAVTFPAGFVSGGVTYPGGGFGVAIYFAKKLSNGTETGNFSVSLLDSEAGAWRVFRITGASTVMGTSFGNTTASLDHTASTTGLDTGSPDPPSHDPNTWDTADFLWLAMCGVENGVDITAWPLSTNQSKDVGSSSGATLGCCWTNSAVSSLDPGTYTIASSVQWVAATIAIAPYYAAKTGLAKIGP